MVLSGKGLIYIDGESIAMVPGDIIKVDAIARRSLKADDELELVCSILGGLPVGRISTKSK